MSLGALALALWLFAFATPALAGPPVHLATPGLDISGFNHACGTAVDSEGDVYVASAGESKIRIFDPAHAELTFIANANEPCGLAVDSTGRVYVSESATGNVVRYTPNAYPFSGTPTYGAPATIDASTNAKGISVDPSDDRLYVARGDHIAVYEADGQQGIDETQVVSFAQTAGGTFRLALPGEGGPGRNEVQRIDRAFATYTLTFNGQTTAPLAANATAPDVDSALEALSTIGPGKVAVTGFPNRTKWVEFTGTLAQTDVFTITGTGVTAVSLSDITAPIPFGASTGDVDAALEALQGIGPGNVSVQAQGNGYRLTFVGALARTDVPELAADPSALTPDGSGFNPDATVGTTTQSFDGLVGEGGDLTDATGVAAHTFPGGGGRRYLFAADDTATDVVKIFNGTDVRNFKPRATIDGADTPDGSFGFGPAGAYLAADSGYCPAEADDPAPEQACTAGHFFLYDDTHEVLDEFEANGRYLTQITKPQLEAAGFTDAEPSAVAVDRSGGPGDGALYLSTGNGAAAKLLAFGSLAPPSRPPLPGLSQVLATAKAVATDSEGNVYVAAGSLIHVYGPDGKEIRVGPQGDGIPTPEPPTDLAVDSTCKVYALFIGNGTIDPEQYKVQYYTPPSSCPEDGTQYSGPVTVATGDSFLDPPIGVTGIEINPANDHVFVISGNGQILELRSAAEGSAIFNPCFGCTLSIAVPREIAIYGANGNVYVPEQFGQIFVIDPTGTEVLARIAGAGSPKGPFSGNPDKVAVDQSNGHVLVFNNGRGVVEEYDASGAFVTEFGQFTTDITRPSRIAIDNSGGPSDGNVYVAFDDAAPGSFDLTAFGPLTYGDVPLAATGLAAAIGAGNATLNGTVDPRGFALTDCHFEYLTDAQYQIDQFASASTAPCTPDPAGIGSGSSAVAVHADLAGLDPDGRYRFRLLAANKFGTDESDPGLFGPPLLTTRTALPILYTEATLRAEVDPSGLPTKYHFEYGTDSGYGQSTPITDLAPGDGPIAIEAPLTGLAEGTDYHFRLLAENEAKSVPGPDQTFTTLARAPVQDCPNPEFRTGLSAKLPDCRAYELVTPADTRGSTPGADTASSAGQTFNNWLVAPRGAGAGERVAYFALTLPGFEGTGKTDAYRAQRAEGPHPAAGWANEPFGPTYAQAGSEAKQAGVASDQRYGFFFIGALDATFERGQYLRTPSGFEPIAKGSLGTDLRAAGGGTRGPFVSAGGAHVVFFSDKHLEPEAAPEGTVAVYDRVAGASSAEVVSVKPDGTAFGAGEDATYIGATEDGSAVVFEVADVLYLHRQGETVEIAAAPNSFAGISEAGGRVFYAEAVLGETYANPADLFACDVEAGPCAGPGAHPATEIAPESIFVNVSPDGSGVLFTSTAVLDAANQGTLGADNLYLWDGAATRFVAILDAEDFESFGGNGFVNLLRWAPSVSTGVGIGRSDSPTRATPDGEVFVFQSHAQLTSYDNEGHGEIYRYEPGAESGGQLVCVSCDPTGAPPSADAQLLVNSGVDGVIDKTTLVPNLTDDGEAVFFQSPDRLLPEDANAVQDVYQWKAEGAGGCGRAGGCLALISSGQGEEPSYLYGMSADGSDVFFETPEKLVGADIPGSPSIYDARVEGGIPDPPTKAPCQGDACQGQGSTPPELPSPARTGSGAVDTGPVSKRPRPRCGKGKRKVRRNGKTRCVKKHQKRKRSHRANGNRRAAR